MELPLLWVNDGFCRGIQRVSSGFGSQDSGPCAFREEPRWVGGFGIRGTGKDRHVEKRTRVPESHLEDNLLAPYLDRRLSILNNREPLRVGL